MAGISRSTAIVAAYIMAVTNLNWKEALKAIKCSRSIANPNYGFQRQLQDFCNSKAGEVIPHSIHLHNLVYLCIETPSFTSLL